MTHSLLAGISAGRHLLTANNPRYDLQFNGGNTAMEVLAIALIVVGILVTLFSIAFRRSHCSLALLAFSWGAFYYAIYKSLPNLSTETVLWASALAALGVALIPLIPGPYIQEYSALKGRFYVRHSMSRMLVRLTAGLIGVCAGLVIWWAIFGSYSHIYNGSQSQQNYAWGIMAVLGGVLGIVHFLLGNLGIVIGTPIVGSFLAIQGFNYFSFAQANINVFLVLDRDIGTCTGNHCLIDMACFAGGVGLGWIIQGILYMKLREEFVVVPVASHTTTYIGQPQTLGYANTSTTYTGEPSYNSYNTGYEPNRYTDGAAYTPSHIKQSNVYTPSNYAANNDYPTLNLGNQPRYYA